MATITKKTTPTYFNLVLTGKKRFDVRVKDFEIDKGDTLVLKEWDPKKRRYTGRQIRKKVDYVMNFDLDEFGQRKLIEKKGLVVIQLDD